MTCDLLFCYYLCFSLGREIGSGEFGTVFQGVWHNGKQEVQVAVKTLYSSPLDDSRIRLMKEAAMVEQFLHNNIVRLHGVVLKGNPVRTTPNILYCYINDSRCCLFWNIYQKETF